MDTDTDTSSNARLEETLPKDAYVSHDAYRRELERIFYRQWVCVARDEAIPEAGDFLRLAVADESVIVTRTRTGEVRGFYNVCRHRGSQLVPDEPPPEPEGDPPAPAGRFRGSIVCPYHAWTYGLDGQLRAAPFLDERHGLRRDMLPLHPIGIERWGGFIFANLTPEDAPVRRADRPDPRPDPSLPAARAPDGGACHLRGGRQLEGGRRELQRVANGAAVVALVVVLDDHLPVGVHS